MSSFGGSFAVEKPRVDEPSSESDSDVASADGAKTISTASAASSLKDAATTPKRARFEFSVNATPSTLAQRVITSSSNATNEMEDGEIGDASVESTPIPDDGSLGDINTMSSADYIMNRLELANFLDNMDVNNDELIRQTRIEIANRLFGRMSDL